MKNKIALIHELIESYNLKDKTRERATLYKRYYLYNELRGCGFSLTNIGEIFGKNHATIIHGLRVHKDLTSYRDEDYRNEVHQLKEYLDGSVLVLPPQNGRQVRDLKTDILDARSLREFKRIRKRVKLGVYEKLEAQSNLLEE